MLILKIKEEIEKISKMKGIISDELIKNTMKALLSDYLATASYVAKVGLDVDIENEMKSLLFKLGISDIQKSENVEKIDKPIVFEDNEGKATSLDVNIDEFKILKPNLTITSADQSSKDNNYENDITMLTYLNNSELFLNDDDRVRIIMFLNDIEEEYKDCNLYPPIVIASEKEIKYVFDKISTALTPEILFYLRYIIHPFKNNVTIVDLHYLKYLILIEQWDFKTISILIGNGWKKEELNYIKSLIDKIDEPNEDYIKKIESYQILISDIIKNDDRVVATIDSDKKIIDISIDRKKVLFDKEIGSNYLFDYLKLWGMLFKFQIPKNYIPKL